MSEPLSDERLAAIARAVMPMVTDGDIVPTAAAENALRSEWASYRDDLLAEVERLRGFVKYLADLPHADNTAGALIVLKEMARRKLSGQDA